jgi:tetratricopeptide (TPR) repeat protein
MNRPNVRLFIGALALQAAACAHAAPLPPKAVELNRKGAEALAGGDLTEAEARLGVALEYNPRFTEAWVNLGLVELKRANFDRARADLKRAVRLNADLPTPHHGLGLVADEQGRPKEAEAHYRDALKVDPGFAPARVNLGRLLFARGAFEEAREQFLRLTQIAPDSVEGWCGLVETLWRLGRYEEGNVHLAAGHKKVGDVPAIVVLRARQALRDGDAADAETWLEPITQAENRLQAGDAWAWLSVARLTQGDRAGAGRAAHQATRLDPTNAVAAFVVMRTQDSTTSEVWRRAPR